MWNHSFSLFGAAHVCVLVYLPWWEHRISHRTLSTFDWIAWRCELNFHMLTSVCNPVNYQWRAHRCCCARECDDPAREMGRKRAIKINIKLIYSFFRMRECVCVHLFICYELWIATIKKNKRLWGWRIVERAIFIPPNNSITVNVYLHCALCSLPYTIVNW